MAVGKWNFNNNVLLVVGATYPKELKEIRSIVGDMPFLVPGIGAQGGDVQKTVTNGKNPPVVSSMRATGAILRRQHGVPPNGCEMKSINIDNSLTLHFLRFVVLANKALHILE
jgi:hypothetical protein